MLRNTRGTLTLSNSDFVHILVFVIFLYNLCVIAISEHLKALLPKNYVCVVAFAPELRKSSFIA
jgi:hypothetical protein